MAETIIDTLVTEFVYRTRADQLKGLDKQLGKVQGGLIKAAGLFTTIGTAAVGAFGVASKAAIDWQSAFTGVRKTVEATDEELARIEASLRRMAREELPLGHAEIAGIAEAAGQLGVQTSKIEGFVEVMASLGVATNLTADSAATQLARFANIVQMSQDDFGRLGSTIVDLGNNMATTEAEIVDMGLRLAGAGKLIGLSEHQIVAFAGALSSVGLESEAGGTAFSRVWAEMQAAIQTGSEEITTFAKVAGVTRDEFVYAFGRDASDAVLLFLDGLKGMVDTGANVHAELENLGFDSVRIRDSLLRSAGAGDLLSDALNRAEKAWEDNTALTREAELRFESMASQVTFLKNNLYDLRIEVGEALIPALRPLVGIVIDILDKMRIWVSENPQGVLAIAKLSVAVLVLGGALIGLIGTISTLRYTIGLWTWLSEAGVFISLGKAFTTLGGVAKATFARMALWGLSLIHI